MNILGNMKYLTFTQIAYFKLDKCLKINKIANLLVFSGLYAGY